MKGNQASNLLEDFKILGASVKGT